MIPAKRSKDRKYIVCGACRATLCRRDRMIRAGRTEAGHYLVWDDGIVLNEAGYVEMPDGAQDRLSGGWKPTRHDWMDRGRIELSRALASFAPARCRQCREVNSIDPRRLDVQGVAPRG
jgi:hypothetical protein